MNPLFKTSIIIWSEYTPHPDGGTASTDADEDALSVLAHEACVGDAYCSKMSTSKIKEPEKDPDWDGTEFFGVEGDPSDDLCPRCRHHSATPRPSCAREWPKRLIVGRNVVSCLEYELVIIGATRSISDDDLCASCSNCQYHPGLTSGCGYNWPATFDRDSYATSCDSYLRMVSAGE